MRKIINIIVISFFIVFSVNEKFGIALLLPILLILFSHKSKDLILSIPLSITSSYIFNRQYLLIIIVAYLFIILFLLIIQKRNKIVIELILCFVINIGILLYLNNDIDINKIIWIVLIATVSIIIYYLLYLLVIKNYGNYIYFEIFSMLVIILSTTLIDLKINVSLYLAILYVMYFSITAHKIFSYLFSFILMLLLYLTYKDNIFFILPVVNSIYIIGNILSSFILVILMFLVSLFLPNYFQNSLVICLLCIIFEIIRKSITQWNYKTVKNIEEIKKTANMRLNENILGFASFLDGCINDVDSLNEKEYKINEGIDNIVTNYCNRCYIKEKCRKENENPESDLRSLIINCNKKTYHIYNNILLSKCPYNIEIRKSALITNSKIDFNGINEKNGILKKTFTNISHMLRQYAVDNNLKEEIDYIEINKIKEIIINSGYDLCYFNCKEILKDSFSFEIGIRGIEYNEISDVLYCIIKKGFKYPFDLEFEYKDKDKTYLNIFNHKQISIEYSSSNIANGSVSGDNIYILEKGNKFIAGICDGMGKGNNANLESSTIISLFNRLLTSSIATETSLQILNLYCELKKEYDSYSTVDIMEINTQSKKGVFYKMSAASSYIFHSNHQVEKIENELLPIGNEEKVIGKEIVIEANDVIIMSSDGIFENVTNEEELKEFIGNIIHLPVEKIVIQIINYIKKNTRINDDDISLIVLRILSN